MESEQLEREKQKADVQKQQEVQQEQGEDLEVSMAPVREHWAHAWLLLAFSAAESM